MNFLVKLKMNMHAVKLLQSDVAFALKDNVQESNIYDRQETASFGLVFVFLASHKRKQKI